MPAKNSRKIYIENAFYHVYNRGVEKRIIFSDAQDYNVFLKYLKEYLEPKDEKGLYQRLSDETIGYQEKDKILKLLKLNNFAEEINLLAFSLMPNHFHLLIQQIKSKSMDCFLNSLMTRYASYFNRRRKRVGGLFQDVYKAVLVESEPQLLHLSRYIHRNPLELGEEFSGHQELYSSLPEYFNKRKTGWVKPQIILDYFSKKNRRNSYAAFVEENDDLEFLKTLVIE